MQTCQDTGGISESTRKQTHEDGGHITLLSQLRKISQTSSMERVLFHFIFLLLPR